MIVGWSGTNLHSTSDFFYLSIQNKVRILYFWENYKNFFEFEDIVANFVKTLQKFVVWIFEIWMKDESYKDFTCDLEIFKNFQILSHYPETWNSQSLERLAQSHERRFMASPSRWTMLRVFILFPRFMYFYHGNSIWITKSNGNNDRNNIIIIRWENFIYLKNMKRRTCECKIQNLIYESFQTFS